MATTLDDVQKIKNCREEGDFFPCRFPFGLPSTNSGVLLVVATESRDRHDDHVSSSWNYTTK